MFDAVPENGSGRNYFSHLYGCTALNLLIIPLPVGRTISRVNSLPRSPIKKATTLTIAWATMTPERYINRLFFSIG